MVALSCKVAGNTIQINSTPTIVPSWAGNGSANGGATNLRVINLSGSFSNVVISNGVFGNSTVTLLSNNIEYFVKYTQDTITAQNNTSNVFVTPVALAF